MGDKYTPEDLERMRSVGFNKTGRTRFTSAGIPIKEEREGNGYRVTVDERNNVYQDNPDGTQDLTLQAEPIKAGVKTAPLG